MKTSRLSSAALPAALIALAGVAAYAGAMHGPFVFDDVTSLAQNPTIRHLWAWPGPLAPPHAGITVEGRPVLNLSFALNYALGGSAVEGYHAVNLLIHLLAGLTLFGIVRRTLERWSALTSTRLSADGAAPGALGSTRPTLSSSLAIALLWTIHPLQGRSVAWSSGRSP